MSRQKGDIVWSNRGGNNNNNGDDAVPSYEEAIRGGPSQSSISSRKRSGNPFNVMRGGPATTDSEGLIHRFVHSTVASALQTSLSPSHNPQAFDFWPSDYSSDGETPRISEKGILTGERNGALEEVVSGLPENIYYKIIRLAEREFDSQFFRRADTIGEIDTTLRMYLLEEGYSLQDHKEHPSNSEPQLPNIPPPSPLSPPRSLFSSLRDPSRQSSLTASASASSTPMRLGWRSEVEDRQMRPPGFDEIRVDVRMREIYVRKETVMGLQETISFPTVWVEFEVGR